MSGVEMGILAPKAFGHEVFQFDADNLDKKQSVSEVQGLESHYKGPLGAIKWFCDRYLFGGDKDAQREAVAKLTVPKLQHCMSEADLQDRIQAYKYIKKQMPVKFRDGVQLRLLPTESGVRLCLELRECSTLARKLSESSRDSYKYYEYSEEKVDLDNAIVHVDSVNFRTGATFKDKCLAIQEKFIELSRLKIREKEYKQGEVPEEQEATALVDRYIQQMQREIGLQARSVYKEQYPDCSDKQADSFVLKLILTCKDTLKSEQANVKGYCKAITLSGKF